MQGAMLTKSTYVASLPRDMSMVRPEWFSEWGIIFPWNMDIAILQILDVPGSCYIMFSIWIHNDNDNNTYCLILAYT